ncbi:hypothetical protein [Methanonatronarchaeum sp. AMET-Sl]|uniref:phenylacetate--CoA ligase family protein n=1 Tax=Methanonatronarchaeum sp. AMET-Sl TaxID=3037654 RepID=UPI00244E4844|nr:hypothetical protein [Methanonatronarchaeum sp. AMET-Sl]WGI17649.1 hypothetical protein QEN48_01170 [Methanonatronarchaeum sp. AMET-Sl]
MNLISPIRKFYYLKRLQRNQWKGLEELRELQNKKLRKIIKFAYENIPFYHDRFREVGVKPQDIKSKRDLKKLPILTKKEIKENFEDIVNPELDLSEARVVPTSGSTGTPLKVVYDQRGDDFSKAVNLRSHIENGLNFYKKWAIMGDARTVPPQTFFQKFGIFRIQYINLFDDVEKQVQDLKKIQPDVFTGYPSQIELIAEYLNDNNDELNIETVFTTAELLDNISRSKISKNFGSDVIDLFGCIEVNRTAWECEEHMGYHMDIDSVAIEFTKNNKEVSPGEWGDIIYTTLFNYGMPLIRYDVGDRGVPSDEACKCGRGLPLMDKVLGRKGDFIKLKNGKQLSPIPFHLAVKHTKGIEEAKIIQKKKDLIIVKIIGNENYSKKTNSNIRNKVKEICGKNVDVRVHEVDEIRKDSSGKIRMVKSEISET